jgi:hypothetical protein
MPTLKNFKLYFGALLKKAIIGRVIAFTAVFMKNPDF